MVRPLVRTLLPLLLLAPFAFGTAGDPAAADPSRAEVGRALGRSGLPWYDPDSDGARPLQLPPSRWANWRGCEPAPRAEFAASRSWIGLAWFGLALTALVVLLVWLFRHLEPTLGGQGPKARTDPGAGLVELLPEGLPIGFESSDPWAEAIRRRDRGDLAGSIVCLFAYQMLTLGGLGLVRLAPGRTARQLLRAVTEGEARDLVRPTLGLFEATYYGRREPEAAEFAAAWANAEAFRGRTSGGTWT